MKNFFKFIFAMVLSFIPGAIGIMFTPTGASDIWYNAINKSPLTPDGWVFAFAWTILYALLGIALFLIMKSNTESRYKTRPYVLFGIQMVLNALWTYLFFGAHLTGWALVVLAALIVISFAMMRAFFRASRPAAYLIIPYLLWLLFAMYLNVTIFVLN